MEEVIREVSISQIEVDPLQPRKDLGDLEGLKRSIQQHGIVQPPVVTPVGPDHYRILVGDRRVIAARELGWASITVVVRTVDEHERSFVQLVENLQRKDLDPFEQADCFRRLMDEHGISEEEVGAGVGKSQEDVSRILAIADGIPAEVREEYYATSHKVPTSVLLEIARARSPALKQRMWEQARGGRYTVREARAERGGEGAKGGSAASPRPKPVTIPLDRGKVIVQGAATVQQVLEMLREAQRYFEAKIALYERASRTPPR